GGQEAGRRRHLARRGVASRRSARKPGTNADAARGDATGLLLSWRPSEARVRPGGHGSPSREKSHEKGAGLPAPVAGAAPCAGAHRVQRFIEAKNSSLDLVLFILSSRNSIAAISSIGCSSLRRIQIFCSSSGSISRSSRRVPERLTAIAGYTRFSAM